MYIYLRVYAHYLFTCIYTFTFTRIENVRGKSALRQRRSKAVTRRLQVPCAMSNVPCQTCHVKRAMSNVSNQTYLQKITLIQPIADSMAQNLEIFSKKFQFSTRCTRTPMVFIISTIFNFILRYCSWIPWAEFRYVNKVLEYLKILWHPICNWLYI